MLSKKDLELLKLHDELTYDKVRRQYINSLCLFLCDEFNLCKSEAIDLADEAFIKAAYLKIDLFNPKLSNFKTWLYQIAKNLCFDYLKNNVNVASSHSSLENNEPSIEEKHDNLFEDFKKVLTNEEYLCITYFYVYNFSVKEIARKLHKSRYTIYRIIKSAEKKIKKIVEEYYEK